MDDGQDTPVRTAGTRAGEETDRTPRRSTERAAAPGPSTPLLPATPTTEEQTPGTLRRLFQTPPRRPRRSRAAAGLEIQEPSPPRPLETPPRRPPKRARFTTGFGSPSSPTGSGAADPSSPVDSAAEPSLASSGATTQKEGVAPEIRPDAAVEGDGKAEQQHISDQGNGAEAEQGDDAFVVTEAGPSGDAEREDGSGVVLVSVQALDDVDARARSGQQETCWTP